MIRPATILRFACALALSALCASAASAADAGGGDVLCVSGVQSDAAVLAGTSRGGIYRSMDGGAAWMQTGLRTGAAHVLAQDPRNASHFYAGTSLGLYASTDTGRTWWPVDASAQAKALALSYTAPRVLLASDGAAVRRTADDGRTWDEIAPLAPFGITLLASARRDTGTVFAAACDSAIFVSMEKNQAAWTRLPALPRAGREAARITAIVMDTLSADGLNLAAGTSTGVFVYSFAKGTWRDLSTGLPGGSPGAMALIAYDTTLATRAYSLCAYAAGDSGSGFAQSGVYKISSAAGVLDTAAVWNRIMSEAVPVRGCFAPVRGANRAKLYLATSDGLRISYDGGTTWTREALAPSPIALPEGSAYHAGVVGLRGSSRAVLRAANKGEAMLALRAHILSGAEYFTVLSGSDAVSAAAGDTCSIDVDFAPPGPGKYTAQLAIETNDPLLPSYTVTVTGFCTGKSTVRRSVVIDRSHGGAAWTRYAALANAFTLAGMSVIDTLPRSPVGTDCAMIVLPAPAQKFTEEECAIIAQSAADGATVVALCGEDETSRGVLNDLFASDVWQGEERKLIVFPLKFNTGRITSAAGAFDAHKSSGLSSAPWLAGSATYRFSSAQELVMVEGADTLFTARGVTRTDIDGARADVNAMVAGVVRRGKGKVILIGSADFWAAADASNGATGLWAGDNFEAALSIAGTVENGAEGMKARTEDETYSLFSIPYPPADNAVSSVLAQLGAPDPMKWRLFGAWNDRSQAYAEYPSPQLMTIERGKGYWLITKGEQKIATATADYSLIPEAFTLTLAPGFTLIGNPYHFPVDWERSVRPDGVEPIAWWYNGKEFAPTSILQPFTGYFVFNASDSAATVRVVPDPVLMRAALQNARTIAEDKASATSAAEGEWSMHVTATDGTASDDANFCGMLRASQDGRDDRDHAEPPLAPGRSISFRFVAAGCASRAADYKSVHEDGTYWDCEVETSLPGADVSLQLAPETPMPEGWGIYLLDRADERVTDCSNHSAVNVRFAPDERVRAFRLIAGKMTFVGQHTDGVPMTPLAYALEQNFPNPWNPSTTIRFTLAHSAAVRLEIFDVLGRRVRTLIQAALPIGSHAQEWDGRDDAGVAAASGVYIYRLTTPAYTRSRRMVLLR